MKFYLLLFCVLLTSCERGNVECYSEGKQVYKREDVKFIQNDRGFIRVYEPDGSSTEFLNFNCITIKK